MKFSLKKFLYNVAASVCLLFLSLVINGQVSECPKLSISGPDTVASAGTIRVSARIVPESATKNVDWLVVKENYRSKKMEVESLSNQKEAKITTWNSNDSGLVTVVSMASFSSECQIKTAHRVIVVENEGPPLILDEYGAISWNDEKAKLDAAMMEMEKRPKHELIIYRYFLKNETGATRRLRQSRTLDHAVRYRKFSPKRITFFISTGDTTRVKFQSISTELVDVIAFDEFLVIPAEKFEQYRQFFR